MPLRKKIRPARGAAFGILSGILAMPFSRAAAERRLSNIDGGGSKEERRNERTKERKKKKGEENKRCLHAFPARRPDRKGRRGGYEIETRRVSALESIRSARSVPEADRGGDAFSIVTNCLVKEGPYVYKDHPPPPPAASPFLPERAVARRDSKHNTRASRRTTDQRVRSILLRESLACLYI